MVGCRIPCLDDSTSRPLPVQFLEVPADMNNASEVPIRDVTWNVISPAYATVKTGTAREVWKARHAFPDVSAVVTCVWSPTLNRVTSHDAVRVNNKIYFIVAAINVDEANEKLEFYCRGGQAEA